MDMAVIFDMDGVVVDNYRAHQKAWEIFCSKYQLPIRDDFRSSVFGGTNKDHLEAFFGKWLTQEEVARFESEKEKIYRDLYEDDIRPLPGLLDFLNLLRQEGVKIGLATSSPPVNVEFVLRLTGTESYFDVIQDATHITHGKPHPEIFIKTALRLGCKPSGCFVFEDSMHGITAARRAGMKIIGVATTHEASDLKGVDLVIHDFKGLKFSTLKKLG